MKLLLCTVLLWLPAIGFTAPYACANGDPLPIRETVFYAKNGNPDWLAIRPGVEISAADLIRLHKNDLGLTDQDELVLYRTDRDDIGFTHYRYQQYHKGVKVDGGELLVHEKDGLVRTLNGKLVRGLQVEIRTSQSADDAFRHALEYIPAKRYMWEDPKMEALLRRVRKDPNATYYPKPELVLMAPGFTHQAADFQAAWRLEVYAADPEEYKELFVSASTGEILDEVNLLHDQNTPGTAVTKYSGTKEIVTDSIGPGEFRLVETSRGDGIETYNMQTGTNFGAAVDFIDDDNMWDTFNAAKDEVATDAHWGAEMTYDYFFQNHGLASLDGNNMALICYVHYDINYQNASWNGAFARFGDGNGITWAPLVSLDVVAHEFTHGVTGFSAGLRYRNESGALNESFSDIFGAAVEFWADPDQGDWLVGEDFILAGSPLRNMASPKKEDNPDTYKGEFWVSGASDNGGVHTNSGVQNKWFYLLTDGGSGRNDNDYNYEVNGVGLDTAAAIAFRNLQYYLVVLSNYADAREGSLQAAEDLYGPCSVPVLEVASAWYAVGVGKSLAPYDLKTLPIDNIDPLTCGLSDMEPITIHFRYSGCNADLPVGEKIPVAYQINTNPVVRDTIVLTDPLTAGEYIDYTFSTPASEFATPGTYHLRCWTAYGADTDPANNEVSLTVESLVAQNVDVRLQKVERPASSCFLGSEPPQAEISFQGCDSIPKNTPVTFFYSVNGAAPVSETIGLPKTLYTGGTYQHTFSQLADFSADGEYNIDVWVKYGPDYLNNNDSLVNLRVVNPVNMFRESILTFEAGDTSLDSLYTATTTETRAELSADAARSGASGIRITGGDIDKALLFAEAQIPTATNVWDVNEQFRSKVCVCADLSDMTSAELRFDHKQTFSRYYLNKLGYNVPYASAMRVLVNGDPISPTYKPLTQTNDSWKLRKFDLADYLGSTIEVCFETHTGISPELDTYNSQGDKVLLDNIAIVGQGLVGTSNPATAEPDWSIRPNPSTGRFTVALRATDAQEISLDVLDALGRSIRTLHASVGEGSNLIPLDLEGQPAGIYFVRLRLEQEQFTRRVIVKE